MNPAHPSAAGRGPVTAATAAARPEAAATSPSTHGPHLPVGEAQPSSPTASGQRPRAFSQSHTAAKDAVLNHLTASPLVPEALMCSPRAAPNNGADPMSARASSRSPAPAASGPRALVLPHDDAAKVAGAAVPTCSTAAPTPRSGGTGSETAAEADAGAIIPSPGPVSGDALAIVPSAASGSAPVRQDCNDPEILEMQPHLVTETDTHKVFATMSLLMLRTSCDRGLFGCVQGTQKK